MGRKLLQTMVVVGLLGSVADAQQPVVFVGAGSTWQGDYLRGVGIEAYGLGVFLEQRSGRESNQR